MEDPLPQQYSGDVVNPTAVWFTPSKIQAAHAADPNSKIILGSGSVELHASEKFPKYIVFSLSGSKGHLLD